MKEILWNKTENKKKTALLKSPMHKSKNLDEVKSCW